MNDFMNIAIEEAKKGVINNHGGPVGAVITQNGKIIAQCHNNVILKNDPTAHAEIEVIRVAGEKLGRFDLSDCEIYSSCEPCPMCLSAIIWARIKKLYYGCNRFDAEKIGFDDNMIYKYFSDDDSNAILEKEELDRDNCLSVFIQWIKKEDKVNY